ncbi:ubiquitin-specific protease otu1 [Spiromyces aspiralis]|uniref:Ubiquitin-specific protease otu1 n=1 Tax=Spiromyces aspiralis TaxID=68401 RepID=A0ACC1HLD8_9FUNG|nr:ubiquitin-specific protease otu1 [Spiromyces aspiralis]
MRFRIQGPDFRKDITNVEISTLGELRTLVEAETGISRTLFQLKAGVPPRIVTEGDDIPLQNAGIQSNDRLLLIINDTKPRANSTRSVKKGSEPKYACVPIHSGYMVQKKMPEDNSCLFHALSFILGDDWSVSALRELTAHLIYQNQKVYNDAILGMPVNEYCLWIEQSKSWGGAIELALLSDHFGIELCSIDVKTLRMDRFGMSLPVCLPRSPLLLDIMTCVFCPDRVCSRPDVDYDAVAFIHDLNDPGSVNQTQFIMDDDVAFSAARGVAQQLHDDGAYTELSSISHICSICNAQLRGVNQAQAHAAETGHTNFRECG